MKMNIIFLYAFFTGIISLNCTGNEKNRNLNTCLSTQLPETFVTFNSFDSLLFVKGYIKSRNAEDYAKVFSKIKKEKIDIFQVWKERRDPTELFGPKQVNDMLKCIENTQNINNKNVCLSLIKESIALNYDTANPDFGKVRIISKDIANSEAHFFVYYYLLWYFTIEHYYGE